MEAEEEEEEEEEGKRDLVYIDTNTLVLLGGCRSVLSDCSAEVRDGNS